MIATKSILMVGNEFALLHTLSLILIREGYQVTIAANTQQALVVLNQRKIDLLLIDLESNQLSPSVLIPKIRTTHPQVAILLLTSFKKTNLAEQSIPYLVKPVDPVRVIRAVQNQIGP